MMGLRMKRGLWYMMGRPHCMTATLKSDAMANKVLRRFIRDLNNFNEMCAIRAPTEAQQKVIDRSQFNTVACKQYICAVEELPRQDVESFDPLWMQKVRTVALNRVKGPLGTHMIELFNGVQKNRERATHSSTVLRKPLAAWAQVLASEVLSNSHKWDEVLPDVPVKQKCLQVTKICV